MVRLSPIEFEAMTRGMLRTVLLLLVILLPVGGAAQFTKPYRVVDLTDDIFAIVWDDILSYPVEGNKLVIINENDVVVVDSKRTSSLARTVIEEIRKGTDKPVRCLINTHWHADHFYANYVFQEDFPGVEIIGHPATSAGVWSVLVPGHGDVQHDLAYLHLVRELFASLSQQVRAGVDRGWDLETINTNVDLRSELAAIVPDRPGLAGPFTRAAVKFAYRELMRDEPPG